MVPRIDMTIKKIFLFFLILPLLLAWFGGNAEPPTICSGQDGVCYIGSWKRHYLLPAINYASFQGIRYAQPPVGKLRFKPPEMFVPKEPTYDVSGTSTITCPQLASSFFSIKEGITNGQEDCLLLNIYVPESVINQIDNTKVPVMVWIHGGGLITGSNNFGEYGPSKFMTKDVIVVAINYRLGPIGFLSMGTPEVPGNAGLRDQSMALSWIKENIAYFGGNPELVTLFGESAGSLSIALHLTSPLSQGLFQRAILQSGTALGSDWGLITQDHALQYAENLVIRVGCEQEENTLECLQDQNLNDIMAMTNMMPGYVDGGAYIIWSAVPDEEFTKDPFLPGDPEELLISGKFNKDVELIIGTNDNEGILDMMPYLPKALNPDPTLWDQLRNNFETLGPGYLFNIANQSEITSEDVEKMHEIVSFYVGSIDNINEEHMDAMIDMFTDAGYLHGTYKTIKHLLNHNMSIYNYILTHEGFYSLTLLNGILPKGVCHADDLFYLWKPFFGYEIPLFGADVSVSEILIDAWTNFAKHGNPTPNDQESGFVWAPMKSFLEYQYLNISGQNPTMSLNNPKIISRMAIWERVLGE